MFIGEQIRLTGMPCVACVQRKKSWGSFLLLRVFDYAGFFSFVFAFSVFFFLRAMRYLLARQAIIMIKELVRNPN